MKSINLLLLPLALFFCGCQERGHESYAVLAEYGQDNKVMIDGVNRRVLNTVLSSQGDDIVLNEDGSIKIKAGRYRISGYSLVTMQDDVTVIDSDLAYPGYCIVYHKKYENDRKEMLKYAVAVGQVSVALYSTPSIFDNIAVFPSDATICLGHQSGKDVQGVYLTFVDGDPEGPSESRVFAQITIIKMD